LQQYVVNRGNGKTVIAGYPWFLDWGRDTLIVARGLIAAGNGNDVLDILRAYAVLEESGTLPNMIRGTDSSNRNTSDAALWFFVVCRDLHRHSADGAFLDTQCGQRSLREVLIDMATALERGTPNGIHADPDSGLLFSPTHFTWMDTNHPPGTPREGYPIEIQALWQAALAFLAQIDPEHRGHWRERVERVRASVERYFYLSADGYLADCLYARPGLPAAAAQVDDALRPNQLLAVTLSALTDKNRCRQVVAACGELLVPGGMRSLADRPVRRPLVIEKDSRLLGDPRQPYRGRYIGDEDTSRKPAYHNGTAWGWQLPLYCEALALTCPESGPEAARAYLAHSIRMLGTGCVGHLAEIFDGDAPHTARGCDAQAWSVSELLRVWHLLNA
jgi:predicted glycogen debranching enzyme